MSLQVEKLEKNMAKLTVEVPAEQFEAALKTSYNKNKNKFNIPGFRKGKAPQAMIEKMYGVGVFYEDAVDEAINASYPDAAKESGLEIVSRPSISIEEIEEGKAFVYHFAADESAFSMEKLSRADHPAFRQMKAHNLRPADNLFLIVEMKLINPDGSRRGGYGRFVMPIRES